MLRVPLDRRILDGHLLRRGVVARHMLWQLLWSQSLLRRIWLLGYLRGHLPIRERGVTHGARRHEGLCWRRDGIVRHLLGLLRIRLLGIRLL